MKINSTWVHLVIAVAVTAAVWTLAEYYTKKFVTGEIPS
jgi:hypothetical protein